MVAGEVVLHRAVLDDVDVAERSDDALADRVVPARDVRDDRDAQAARRDEERDDRVRLDVREHQCRALALHALAESAGDVAQRSEVPGLHPPLEPVPPWKRPRARGVEHPVVVTGRHALAMESLPLVQPDRERVVADPPVEPAVEAAAHLRR